MSRFTWTSCLVLAAVLGAAAADAIKEPETGKTFDAQVKGVTPGVTLTCTGAGCRKKTILAVKVYAIAHWIDAQGAAAALSEWRGKPGKDLAADQRFFDALSSADVEKRLSLVFVHDVTAGELRDAFKESLDIPYSRKLSAAAEKFLALFKADVKVGQSIELRSLPGGVIEASQDGTALGRVPADKELAAAVWAIYFHQKLADSYLTALRPALVARIDAIW